MVEDSNELGTMGSNDTTTTAALPRKKYVLCLPCSHSLILLEECIAQFDFDRDALFRQYSCCTLLFTSLQAQQIDCMWNWH